MKIKIPDFKVEADRFGGQSSVTWTEGDRRYHFWIGRDGEPNGPLHFNPVTRNPDLRFRDEHRSLNPEAKKWAPMIAAIMAQIRAGDLIARARIEASAKARADNAERISRLNLEHIGRFNRAAATMPGPASRAMLDLADEEKLAFIGRLERV